MKQEKIHCVGIDINGSQTSGELQQSSYNIYPTFSIGNGKIEEGIEVLAEWIIRNKTVIIDGYIGVFWEELTTELNRVLEKRGKTIRCFHTEAALRPSSELEDMLIPFLGGEDPLFGKITDKTLDDWFVREKLDQIQPDNTVDINLLIGIGAALFNWKAPLIYVDLPKNELQFRMRAGRVFNLGMKQSKENKQMYKHFYFVDWKVLDSHKCKILPQIERIVDAQRPGSYLSMSGDALRQGLTEMGENFFRVRPWFEPGAWGGNWMKNHIEGLNQETPNLAWSFELMVLENGLMFESDGYRLEVSFDFLMYNSYKEVLGDCAERFKYDFPIRFDFLDTFDGGNLSVQCHPRPEYIKEKFGMPFTQDETYYILDCKEDAFVYLGFQKEINPDEFYQALQKSHQQSEELNIELYVQKFKAKKHNLYLIPNGTIHASGKNNMVLEISSAPYIFTFKMYDWLRLDLDGKPRPINIEHGMNNLYFERQGEVVKNELISRSYIIEQTDDYIQEHLPTHPNHFYDVHRYQIKNEIRVETNGKCQVWMVVEGGSVILETLNGKRQRFNYAETFVVPAACNSYRIINEGKKDVLMVKAFIK